MVQKPETVSGSKLSPNGNCLAKNLAEGTDCTDHQFVDLGEIKKEKLENIDEEYLEGEDPLNICGMRKKRKRTQQEKLNNNGQHKTDITSFKCSICDYIYSTKQRLTFHIVSVHEGKKPFITNVHLKGTLLDVLH